MKEIKNFKELKEKSRYIPEANMKINPILSNYIEYSQANILEDYKNIKPNNSIIFLRNFLPYLDGNNNSVSLKDKTIT